MIDTHNKIVGATGAQTEIVVARDIVGALLIKILHTQISREERDLHQRMAAVEANKIKLCSLLPSVKSVTMTMIAKVVVVAAAVAALETYRIQPAAVEAAEMFIPTLPEAIAIKVVDTNLHLEVATKNDV